MRDGRALAVLPADLTGARLERPSRSRVSRVPDQPRQRDWLCSVPGGCICGRRDQPYQRAANPEAEALAGFSGLISFVVDDQAGGGCEPIVPEEARWTSLPMAQGMCLARGRER
jgi:hypothetical protein